LTFQYGSAKVRQRRAWRLQACDPTHSDELDSHLGLAETALRTYSATAMDPIFLASKSLSDKIEGMLSPFSMAAVDSLLAYQAELGVRGDMVELGVHRGKSAAILAGRLNASETLRLYDVADYFDREALAEANGKLSFNIVNTGDLNRSHFGKRSIRFCHIDASHMFEPTIHEMALADHMLAEAGILCLDDYTNLNYSQNIAAIFKYLFTVKTDLTMFMVTNEKAYLCRRSHFLRYGKFVLDSMIAAMAERDILDVGIARTDDSPEYGASYVRQKEPDETDDFYGTAIYGDYYKIRDHRTLPGIARRTLRKLSKRLRRKAP
jgi:Methyltransferase domain